MRGAPPTCNTTPMTRTPLLCAALAAATILTQTSCSYREFSAITTGSSLGGLFGSSIGGLMGGPRGADKGTLAGMVIGGAVGAAVTAQQSSKNSDTQARYEAADRHAAYGDVEYGTYNSPSYGGRSTTSNDDLHAIEVTNVRFLDANNNHAMDADESAVIEMDLYNRSAHTIYNVTPVVSCTNGRVLFSSPATIATIASGQGIHYRTSLRAPRHLKAGTVTFIVKFGSGKQSVTARKFNVQTVN